MEHTFGYVLCCQSPALFLLAAALLIHFFIRRCKARFIAALSLLGCIGCVVLGVILYYQGMLHVYFAVENFWQVRGPGWVGLVLALAFVLYLLVKAIRRAAARRTAEKDASRAEEQRQKDLENAKAAAYEAGRADGLHSAQLFQEPVIPADEQNAKEE